MTTRAKISELIEQGGGLDPVSNAVDAKRDAVRMWRYKNRIPAKFHWPFYNHLVKCGVKGLTMAQMPLFREDYD